jgi:16S rRNA (adenine(1408)-N(1))-methyltransferase
MYADTFAIGIDADARAMAESSRRAAGPARRGGRPNAFFVAAGVEQLPVELARLADLVTVSFPWGSLLRGVLGLDAAIAGAIAALVAENGSLDIAVALTDRDAVPGRASGPFAVADLARIETAYAPLGLSLVEARPLTATDPSVRTSTWARRLGVARTRPGCLIRLARSAIG